MTTNKTPYLVAEITVNRRDDCFHAYSADIPGFHLCADSIEALNHDVPAAIEFLFKVKHGMTVKADRAASPRELTKNHVAKRRAPESELFVMTQAFACA